MKVARVVFVVAMSMVVSSSVFAQTIPTDLAAIMVQEAVATCHAQGLKISAKVVDAANLEKAFLRDEGASQVTVEFVQMKLNTVLLTGRASGTTPDGSPQTVKSANPKQPVFTGVVGLDVAAGKALAGVEAGGAIPIMRGTQLLGAIGVSGAPSAAQDAACAKAGLAKVADKLK